MLKSQKNGKKNKIKKHDHFYSSIKPPFINITFLLMLFSFFIQTHNNSLGCRMRRLGRHSAVYCYQPDGLFRAVGSGAYTIAINPLACSGLVGGPPRETPWGRQEIL